MFADGFATTSVCDPDVVTSAAALGTTGHRELLLHMLIISRCWCVDLFHTGHLDRGEKHIVSGVINTVVES